MNPHLKHTFDHDAEMWHIYDAERSVALHKELGPEKFHDIYHAATWERRGGVNDSGYIWADDTRWSLDAPESPRSVLALMIWRPWHLRGAVDLRDATMSVYLRGDSLDLRGGGCLFWVQSRTLTTRWHFSGSPLAISDGRWADAPVRVKLAVDESQWNRSWTVPGRTPASLSDVLRGVEAYGFSFVGFSDVPVGRLCIDEFELKPTSR